MREKGMGCGRFVPPPYIPDVSYKKLQMVQTVNWRAASHVYITVALVRAIHIYDITLQNISSHYN